MAAIKGPQKLQMRRPMARPIVPRARQVPKGLIARMFQKRVERAIEHAAFEAQLASKKPVLRGQKAPISPVAKKLAFPAARKPVVAQKPVKRRAA